MRSLPSSLYLETKPTAQVDGRGPYLQGQTAQKVPEG